MVDFCELGSKISNLKTKLEEYLSENRPPKEYHSIKTPSTLNGSNDPIHEFESLGFLFGDMVKLLETKTKELETLDGHYSKLEKLQQRYENQIRTLQATQMALTLQVEECQMKMDQKDKAHKEIAKELISEKEKLTADMEKQLLAYRSLIMDNERLVQRLEEMDRKVPERRAPIVTGGPSELSLFRKTSTDDLTSRALATSTNATTPAKKRLDIHNFVSQHTDLRKKIVTEMLSQNFIKNLHRPTRTEVHTARLTTRKLAYPPTGAVQSGSNGQSINVIEGSMSKRQLPLGANELKNMRKGSASRDKREKRPLIPSITHQMSHQRMDTCTTMSPLKGSITNRSHHD